MKNAKSTTTKRTKTKKQTNKSTKKSKQINSKVIAIIAVIAFAIFGLWLLRSSSASDGWSLYWSDEFNGSEVDKSRWGVYNNNYGTGNKQEECNIPNNVSVSSGTLKIVAKKETHNCPAGGGTERKEYTSGFIGSRSVGSSGSGNTSQGKYYPAFARYEMRARLPHGQGLWPAFWLRHSSGAGVAEIDIMEYFHTEQPGKARQSLHFPIDELKDANNKRIGGGYNAYKVATQFENAKPGTGGWHTYRVDIEPLDNGNKAKFVFYIDDKKTGEYTPPLFKWLNNYDKEAMFDIAINMAVGGEWIGNPDDPLGWSRSLEQCINKWPYKKSLPCDETGVSRAQMPATYEVDYVRVYTKAPEAPTPTPPAEPEPTPSDPAPITLATPSNIKATPEDGQVTLNWDSVTGANNYTVRWGSNNQWEYSNDPGRKNPTSNTYTITGLANGKTYDFSLAARDSTGKNQGSGYSQPIKSTPNKPQSEAPSPEPAPVPTPQPPAPAPAPTPPPAQVDTQKPTVPTSLRKSLQFIWDKFANTIRLDWNASKDNVGVTEYVITKNNTLIGSTTSTNFIDQNISTGSRYTYTVQAKDAAGNYSDKASTTARVNCFLIWCSLE